MSGADGSGRPGLLSSVSGAGGRPRAWAAVLAALTAGGVLLSTQGVAVAGPSPVPAGPSPVPAAASGSVLFPASEAAAARVDDGVFGDFTDSPLTPARVAPALPAGARVVAGYEPGRSTLTRRDASSELWANPDGTSTVRLSTEPLGVQVASGEYVPVDTGLVGASAADVPAAARSAGRPALSAGVRAAAHPLSPVFGKDDTGGLVAVRSGEVSLRMSVADEMAGGAGAPAPVGAAGRLPGAAGGLVSRARQTVGTAGRGPTVVFPGAAEGADVQYEVTPSSVKESVVLADRSQIGDGVWSFWLDVQGGTPTLEADGAVTVRDAAGEVSMFLPVPYVFDSAGVAGRREPSDVNGTFRLARRDGRWLLDVVAPLGWLADPGRVFPVYVDPPVEAGVGYDNQRSYKSDGTTHSGWLRIGNTLDNNKMWRASMHLAYEQYLNQGYQVVDAEVVADLGGDGGTPNSSTSTLHHLASGQFEGRGEQLAYAPFAYDARYPDSPADTRLVARMRDLFNRNEAGFWFMLQGYEQPGVYSYKSAGANLYLTLNRQTAVPTVTLPTFGATARTAVQPTITATSTDPDGDNDLQYFYRIGTTSNPEASSVWDSGFTPSTQVQVPERVLREDTDYWLRVYASDACNLPTDPCRYGGTRYTFTQPIAFRTQRAPVPVAEAGASPPAGTVASLTPTLTVPASTDQDAVSTTAVRYFFSVATGKDGRTGTAISSGWLDAPTWTVPAGYLKDGSSYTWTAWAGDGVDKDQGSWSRVLTTDLRTGDPKTSPTDSVGPVTVNLANGNAIVTAASPTAEFTRSSVGFSFTYNSQAAPPEQGLSATYYQDVDRNGQLGAADQQVGQRTEAQVNSNWEFGSPLPGALAPDHWLGRWNGFVSVPTSGEYLFGLAHDDTATLRVNGQVLYGPTPCCAIAPAYGTTRSPSSPTRRCRSRSIWPRAAARRCCSCGPSAPTAPS